MKSAEEWSLELFSPLKSGKYEDWTHPDKFNAGVIKQIQLDAIADGLTRYAHWKDGVQYVGACGTTLKDAIEQVIDELGL